MAKRPVRTFRLDAEQNEAFLAAAAAAGVGPSVYAEMIVVDSLAMGFSVDIGAKETRRHAVELKNRLAKAVYDATQKWLKENE